MSDTATPEGDAYGWLNASGMEREGASSAETSGSPSPIVPAAYAWPSNSELIADVARLGYLPSPCADVTFGRGTFWKVWRPESLTAHDLRLDGVDFRHLPHPDASFASVVIDGPYKLNGTGSEPDERYGVKTYASWRDRHALIRDGITECARVVRPRGYVLVKCQAQVVSGAVRWQDMEFTRHAESLRLELVDRFDLLGTSRPQPPRTRKDGTESRQQHAHGRPSCLLVFQAPAASHPTLL